MRDVLVVNTKINSVVFLGGEKSSCSWLLDGNKRSVSYQKILCCFEGTGPYTRRSFLSCRRRSDAGIVRCII